MIPLKSYPRLHPASLLDSQIESDLARFKTVFPPTTKIDRKDSDAKILFRFSVEE
jgi:hypothetical protein